MSNQDQLADEAMRHLDAGETERAVIILQDLVRAHPDVDRFQYRLGLALLAQGETAPAMTHLRTAITLHPAFELFHHTYIAELAKHEDVAASAAAYTALGGLSALPRAVQVQFATAHVARGTPLQDIAKLDPCFFGKCISEITVSSSWDRRGVAKLALASRGFSIEVDSQFATSPMMVERLMSFRRYFDELHRAEAVSENQPARTADLCVDDVPPSGADPVLCFSGTAPHHLLVPDSAFLGSNAYAHLHALARAHGKPWAQRKPQAYWRGSLTGIAGTMPETLALPRVRLCALSGRAIDAKLTGLHQFAHLEPDLSKTLASRELLRDRAPESENFAYRFMIDVDGNSNSWPGLYLKFITAGCVLKVMSAWHQWYYPRLIADRNHLPVCDVEEIPAKLDWCLRHDQKAEAIGTAGRDLVVGMTVESEFHAFQTAWREALRRSQ